MDTSPNPNGYIPIVFTYNGTKFGSYSAFLDAFSVTLPGGAGVELGGDQYVGYSAAAPNEITLGTSNPLSSATSAITDLLPTNARTSAALTTAFENWARQQAASPGETAYANLYLSHYTGGRVYLSNGDLQLGPTGEPTPAGNTDASYLLNYGIFEPFIGAQIGHPDVPGNLADISYIDWFSVPITLKTWCFDFGTPETTTLTDTTLPMNEERGGDGGNIVDALLIGDNATPPTNGYPSAQFPATNGSTTARRLAGPTMAAAAQSYYTDPATNPYPYHYFDDYLVYLQTAQGSTASSFTLAGSFGGIGDKPTAPNLKEQTFSFDVDFSNITTETNTYPSAAVTQIDPTSSIVLTGSTDLFGSAAAPFTITLPWAKGEASHALRFNTDISDATDAVKQGWLKIPTGTASTAASGTYSPVTATVYGADGRKLAGQDGTTDMQLIYSVNSDPLAGASSLDNLYQDGAGMLKIDGLDGLTCTANATYNYRADSGDNRTTITIKTNGDHQLSVIQVNDLGDGPLIDKGSTWVIPANATGLGNNQTFTVTLNDSPPLRNVFTLHSASYTEAAASLSVAPTGGEAFTLDVTEAGQFISGWQPNTTWTTLCQPAGIYGANTGYTVAGIQGDNSSFNGDSTSLQNDLFGWIVADLLAALNTGLVGAPAMYPPDNPTKPIGESSADWFTLDDNPYTHGLWGQKAWAGHNGADGQPIDNFWNTWAYDLATVDGGTDAYGFAFTDRFETGILLGYDPPPDPLPVPPKAISPVLLEVIVGDSPLMD